MPNSPPAFAPLYVGGERISWPENWWGFRIIRWYLHWCRLTLQNCCENRWYFGLRQNRSVSLYQSEIQCSQECARTEWHRTSGKRAFCNRELNDIGQFLTSERQEGSTDNVVKGDDFRADRGFRFGLFERTVIFFPGLTLWEDQKEEKRKTNLTIEKQEKSRPSTLLSSFFSRNWRNLSDIKYAN